MQPDALEADFSPPNGLRGRSADAGRRLGRGILSYGREDVRPVRGRLGLRAPARRAVDAPPRPGPRLRRGYGLYESHAPAVLGERSPSRHGPDPRSGDTRRPGRTVGSPQSSGDAVLLAELTDFVSRHRAHGQLIAEATEPTTEGYMLSVAGDPHRVAPDLSSRRRPHDSPGLDVEPRPVPGAGHFGSLDRPFGQRPSSMGARIAQRVERLSHPKEGDLLAFHFDQLGLLVFQLIGRGHLHEFGHRPFLLWVGSVFDRSFLQPLPPGFASLSSSSCKA